MDVITTLVVIQNQLEQLYNDLVDGKKPTCDIDSCVLSLKDIKRNLKEKKVV